MFPDFLWLVVLLILTIITLIKSYEFRHCFRVVDDKGIWMPYLGTLNPVWYMLFSWNISYPQYVRKLTKDMPIYGSFLLDTYSVVIQDHKLAKEVLGHSDIFVKKPPSLGKEFLGGDNISRANDTNWLMQHSIISVAFRNIDSYVKYFVKNEERLFNFLGKSMIVDNMSDLMQKLTLDILGDAIFGHSFNSLEGGMNSSLESYNYIMSKLFSLSYMIQQKIFGGKKDQMLQNAISEIDTLIDKLIAIAKENQRRGGVIETLLDHIINANTLRDTTEHMSDQQVKDNVKIFFVAGHESTTIALSYAISLLAEYPKYQQRIRSDLADGKTLSLDHFLKESMRLHSPIVQIPNRIALKDTKIGGYMIPKSTLVGISVHGIQRSETLFEKPDEFIPDRWNDDKIPYSASLSFSGGNRVCTAKIFSEREIRHIIEALIRNYEIEKADNVVFGEDSSSFGLSLPVKMKIKFNKI